MTEPEKARREYREAYNRVCDLEMWGEIIEEWFPRNARFFEWTSWHHTGKFANATDFYGLDEEALEEHFGSEVENG